MCVCVCARLNKPVVRVQTRTRTSSTWVVHLHWDGHVDRSLKGKLAKWSRVFGFTVADCAQCCLSAGSLWPFAFPLISSHLMFTLCLIFLLCVPLCFTSILIHLFVYLYSVWEVRKPVVVLFSCQRVYTSGSLHKLIYTNSVVFLSDCQGWN